MLSFKIRFFQVLFCTLLMISFFQCVSKKTTNKKIILNSKNVQVQKQNVLYILDGKEIRQNTLKKINPDDIASIDVIKNAEGIKKYTQKKYDGVVVIYLKKI